MEHDEHISKSTPEEVTEYSIDSYILLEPVQGPLKKGHGHTRRSGPILLKFFDSNTFKNQLQRQLCASTSTDWYNSISILKEPTLNQ